MCNVARLSIGDGRYRGIVGNLALKYVGPVLLDLKIPLRMLSWT